MIVNRIWQHHFGQGIVATPNDFGSQGSRPSHPELLDWLANALIDNGWRLKPIHRLIVTSAVYMQDNRFDEARAAIDRENAFLLALHSATTRGRADPRRDAGDGRAPRSPDVRSWLARCRDAAPQRLFLHQAEPPHPDDDALRLARAPREHRPAQHDHDRPPGPLDAQQRAGPPLRARASLSGSRPAGDPSSRWRRPTGSPSAATRPNRRPGSPPGSSPASDRPTPREGRPDPDRRALVDFCQALSA